MNSSPTKVCSRYATRALVWSIHGYRWILSPIKNAVLGPAGCCRFTPTCSAYAIDALQHHGLTKGLALSLSRLARCHPWGGCGNDPVPAPTQAISSAPRASSAHEFPNALTH